MPVIQSPPGVEGILRLVELPDPGWEARWDRIYLPPGVKDRLLNHAILALSVRSANQVIGLGLHRLLLLAGPPGTGKTTLAGGLANRVIRELEADQLLFVEINPHAFPSQLLGESQRAVARLFERTIPDLARRGVPVIVLLDEIEALAVARGRASLETNPVDVHRSTNAVLTGVDHVAAIAPNVAFVATTNFVRTVDPAFLSRADVIVELGLPDIPAATLILTDTLREIASPAADAVGAVEAIAADCVRAGLDPRRLRKLVVGAACSRRELASAPELVTVDDIGAELARVAPAVERVAADRLAAPEAG